MIKGSIQQEYITIINLFTPNSSVCKYMKQTLTELKKEIATIIVRDFNTPLSITDRMTRQKINKETGF